MGVLLLLSSFNESSVKDMKSYHEKPKMVMKDWPCLFSDNNLDP